MTTTQHSDTQTDNTKLCPTCREVYILNEFDVCAACSNKGRKAPEQHSDSMEELIHHASKAIEVTITIKTDTSTINLIGKQATDYIEQYAQQVAREAEDNLIKKSHQQCECGSDHFATPVRSVQGNITTYCQFRRVRLSELDKESKT